MLISDWSSDVCSSDLFLAGLLVEGVDVDIADLALRLPLHGAKLDDLALYSDVERLVPPRPHDRELDRAAGRAAHLVDRFVQRAAIDQPPVPMGDVIARLQACATRGRVLGGRPDLPRALLPRPPHPPAP